MPMIQADGAELMIVVASNTWGISGSDFLLIYGTLCLACCVVVWLRRVALTRSGPLTHRYQLDECELGMLSGGPRLALTVAAAALARTGAIEAVPGARLEVRHRPKSHATSIESELFEALEREPKLPVRRLKRKLVRADAIRQLEDRLVSAGLMIDRRRARWLGQLWQFAFPLLALGVARLIAGLANHKPIGDLTVLVCLVVIAMFVFVRERPYATSAGESVLGRERIKYRKWQSAGNVHPDLATALFGTPALWRLNPALAAAWRAARPGVGNWRDAYLPERAGMWADGGAFGGGGGIGDGGGG
jgi:uncharacterized protein (TIGR04222 family)